MPVVETGLHLRGAEHRAGVPHEVGLVETVDIRAAMDHVLAAGDTHRTSDLAGSTCMWFWLTGRAGDVRDWFERATRLVDDDRAAPFDRGRLAFACGQMIQLYGDHDRAAALLSAAMCHSVELGMYVALTHAPIGTHTLYVFSLTS